MRGCLSIGNLGALTYLALLDNSVTDVTPLTQLTRLSYLVIVGNPVDCTSSAIATLDENIASFFSDCP